MPTPRHEAPPAETRPDAAPQPDRPAAATPDARTPVGSPAPDHSSPADPGPTRVDPRTAYADPTSSDSPTSARPAGLNTAGLGTTATPTHSVPEQRYAPTPDTTTPATGQPGATPGGVPAGTAPSAAGTPTANPTTNRPTAPTPSTPSTPDRPRSEQPSQNPAFTPRPAADRGPATSRPDPRTTYANNPTARPDIPSRLDPSGSNTPRPDTTRPDTTRPDIGSRLDPSRPDAPRPDAARPDAARPDGTRPGIPSRLDPSGSNTPRPDTARPDSTRPDIGSRLDPTRPDAPRPDAARPDSPRPDIPSRLDPTDANTPRPDTARPDSTRPDIGSRLDPTGQDAGGPDDSRPDTAPEPRRPAVSDRPLDSPGGYVEPTDRDRQRVEDEFPRNPDGTPVRHPDPNEGNWIAAVNGDDPNAPGRNNNCPDTALAVSDNLSGNPTPAAARTPDYDANGNPSDRPDRNGRDRIENALGAKFDDMGDGPDAFRRIEDTLRQNGHGSQAVIITTDNDGRSHAWNAVNHNGTVTYIDGQTGQRSDQPLHNGDNGVFAIPLDPDRNPTRPAPSADPDHNPDNDRRAPEELAGKRTPADDDYAQRMDTDHPEAEDGYIRDPAAPERGRTGPEWQAIVNSQEEPFGSSELGRMVEAARADDAFFQEYAVPDAVLTRHPNVGNLHESEQANYAAFKFVVEPGGEPQVLISRNWPARVSSVPPLPDKPWTGPGHSEKVAAEYLKHVEANLTPPQRVKLLEVYSERAPCRQSGCARILYTTFGKVAVAHSVPHPDDGTGSTKMKTQVKSIKDRRAQIMAEDRRYFASGNPNAQSQAGTSASGATPGDIDEE